MTATSTARRPTAIAALSSLIKLSHTIFALPFAGSAALLALRRPHVPPTPGRVLAMLVAMVSARTAAMAYNRYTDRHIDALNPRTESREIPAGVISPARALLLTITASGCFVLASWSLGTLPGVASLPVLAVLLGYSWTKRFTWAAHLVLGLALALAPGGVWIAMGCRPESGIILLMLAVLTWVAGFDVLYSLQDEHFDRSQGLSSIPVRFGTGGALVLSALLHLVTAIALLACGLNFGRGPFFYAAVALVTALLVYEHWIVGRGDLRRIDKAFFDINGYIGLVFFVLTALDSYVA